MNSAQLQLTQLHVNQNLIERPFWNIFQQKTGDE